MISFQTNMYVLPPYQILHKNTAQKVMARAPPRSQQYRQKHGKPRMLCRYRKLSTIADSPKCENRMPLIHSHYWNLHCVRSVEIGFVMYSHANFKDYF